MGKTNKDRKTEELNIPVMIFCIVGTVLTVLGIMLMRSNNFKLDIISTTGTVTGVQTSTNAEGEVENRVVTLSYKAGKSDYTATIKAVKEDRKIGDKIDLYYDFLSPESVNNKRTGYEGYIAVIIGLILVLKTGPRFCRIIKDNYL